MSGPRVEVTVECRRCLGSGKDPQFGSGSTARPSEPWPCQAAHGGCGGLGYKKAVLTGRDALVMAWARTTLVAMGDRTLYSEALPSVAAAMKAIREWDAAHSAEGEKDGK